MTINDIVKETITALNERKTPLTPDNYLQTFCKIAHARGFSVQECQKKEKFINKLNETMKNELNKYNIQTLDELLTYLVSNLNRLTSGSSGKQQLIIIGLLKNILRTISHFPDREIRELAKASLDRIEYLRDLNSFEIISQKWEELLKSHEIDYVVRLQKLSGNNSQDLSVLLDSISQQLDKNKNNDYIQSMSDMLVRSLTPSLTQSLDDEIATVSYNLNNAPELLTTSHMQKHINSLIIKRINIDKQEVKQRILSLDEMLGNVSTKIINLIDHSNLSHDNIKKIKTELLHIDEHNPKLGFEYIKSKLLKITDSLEIETKQLSEMMQKEDDMVTQMQIKIKKLEHALVQAKREAKIDFLTKLVSKRGLDEELNRVDKSYRRYHIEYSLVFFDIDHFKLINDTYGHEAGDLILKQLGREFLKMKRDIDIFGRYGGEEFLAILPNTSLKGALFFGEKVRQHVEKFHFVYKDEPVPITLSVGVANCKEYDTQKVLIEAADDMLYQAKKNGRNRVFPEQKVLV